VACHDWQARQRWDAAHGGGACRQKKNEIAEAFLSQVNSDLASVVVLRDVVPLLLPAGKDAALVALSVAKADSQVRAPSSLQFSSRLASSSRP
jgi:hypothetical protein